MKRKVLHPAIIKNGTVFSLPAPSNHPRVMEHFGIKGGETRAFMLSDGKIASRELAYRVAKEAGQLRNPNQKRQNLHSEDIWGKLPMPKRHRKRTT